MIYALITSAFKGRANKSSLCKNNFCGRCGETHPSSHSAKAPCQQRRRESGAERRLPPHPLLAPRGMCCWEDGWEESLGWRVPAGEGAQGVHHPFPSPLCPHVPCSASCRAGTGCAPRQQVGAPGLRVWDVGGKVCALLKEDNIFSLWYCFQYFIYKLPESWGCKEAREEAGSWTCDPCTDHSTGHARAANTRGSFINFWPWGLPQTPQRHCSCTREAGSILPQCSGASSAAGLHLGTCVLALWMCPVKCCWRCSLMVIHPGSSDVGTAVGADCVLVF